MTQMPRTFWMVYGAGRGSPTAKHKTPESAIAEATRLARVAPDTEFFVLQAVAHVVKRDVEITAMQGADDDIPF